MDRWRSGGTKSAAEELKKLLVELSLDAIDAHAREQKLVAHKSHSGWHEKRSFFIQILHILRSGSAEDQDSTDTK
jgi:hypothetical protein